MSSLILLKVLGDICVCYAVIGAWPLLFPHDFLLLYPALLCAAGAALAAYLFQFGKPWLRWAAFLLPLASLLFADTLIELLILVPGVVYAGIVIHKGSFAMDYYTYRDLYIKTGTFLSVFAAVIFALGYFEGMFSESWSSYNIAATLMYGLLYAFTGVFLLRQLRMGADSQPRDRMRNNIQMVLVLIIIIAVTIGIVAVEELVKGSITDILNFIMAAVGFIPMVIHELMHWFFMDEGSEYQEALEQVNPTTSEPVPVTYETYLGSSQVVQTEPGFPWWMAVLVLTALCVALAVMLRSMRRSNGGSGSGEDVDELEPDVPQRKESRRSNRSRIRKIYRSYLKLVRRKGLKLRTDHTSLDILDAAPENTDREGATRLRQIYLKARYTDEPITDREVEEAKKALKQADKHRI